MGGSTHVASQPPTVEAVADVYSFFWISVVKSGPGGEALTLAALQMDGLNLLDLSESPPVATVIAEELGGGLIGPDGCLYSTLQHSIYRILGPGGECSFRPAISMSRSM